MNYMNYSDDPFLSTLPEEFYYYFPEVIYIEPEKKFKPIEIYLDDYIEYEEYDNDSYGTDEEYEGRVLLTGPFSCPSLKFVLDHIDEHGIRTTKNMFKKHIYPWVKRCPKYKNLYYKILKERFN